MDIVFGKVTRIIVIIVSILVQIANLFIGNIVVYESTEQISFNWDQLLRNPLFWGILIVNVVYHSIPLIREQKAHEVDENLERAISEKSVELIDLAAQNAKGGDFESANRTLKVLDNIQKRRQK